MAEQRTRTRSKAADNKKDVKKVSGEFKILRAYEFDDGTISFDMELCGITFYRTMIRKGKNGDFIAFPSYKGSDGNYYHYYFIPFEDDQAEKIIDAVFKKLDSETE